MFLGAIRFGVMARGTSASCYSPAGFMDIDARSILDLVEGARKRGTRLRSALTGARRAGAHAFDAKVDYRVGDVWR